MYFSCYFFQVDCSTNPKVGHCEVSESDYYVYIYQYVVNSIYLAIAVLAEHCNANAYRISRSTKNNNNSKPYKN